MFDAALAPAASSEPRIHPADALFALPTPNWQVKGLFEDGAIVQIFGEPGCGKTFAVLDLSLHICNGLPWHGRRVAQGNCLYVCGEGIHGLRARLEAWLLHQGREERSLPGLYWTAQPISLAAPKAVEELIDDASGLGLSTVIVDTLNACFGAGDENSSQAMSAFLAGVRRLRDALGTTVILVHHTGWENQHRGRGHSSLQGAIDTAISVTKDDSLVSVQVRKQRNVDPWPDPECFRFKVIDTDLTDEDGDPITSCVLVATDDRPARRVKPKGRNQQLALQAVARLVATEDPREDGKVLVMSADLDGEMRGMDRNARYRAKQWLGQQFQPSVGGFLVDPKQVSSSASPSSSPRGLTTNDDAYGTPVDDA